MLCSALLCVMLYRLTLRHACPCLPHALTPSKGVASARSSRTAPLEPGGAFMLGGEQDCFGGCVDPSQGFHGLMDEVRLWRTALSQEEIVRRMRWAGGLEGFPELVAWWKFDEPNSDPGIFSRHTVARDASGHGNDLQLETPPRPESVEIHHQPGVRNPLRTGALEFRNGLALNKHVQGFPTRSFTVELWAKGAAVQALDNVQQRSTQLFSFAAQKTASDGYQAPGFLDDAVRLERLLASNVQRRTKYAGAAWIDNTAGAVALHVNSNENTDNPGREALIIFDAKWTDDQWHHVAVTWDYDTGAAAMYLDGQPRVPFFKSDFGLVEERSPAEGGVEPKLATRSSRDGSGSLVLGQDQDCMGGCFSPSDAFNGQLAVVRVWNRPLAQSELSAGMGVVQPSPVRRSGLVGLWSFNPDGLGTSDSGSPLALDLGGGSTPNHLELRGNAPLYVYSTAPLAAASDSQPLPGPSPGSGGYSLGLSDRQVLMLPNFRDFPSTALTLEFWMTSIDRCRPGAPFSYAVGDYNNGDNAFLLFNYNSWGVSVMEDEGHLSDHQSGVSATDGLWHHVAVTWDGATGDVHLYDNGRQVWQVTRGRGKSIPAGGTLVIGREQDCRGGCFDSAAGAAGSISPVKNQEYGAQDFTGVIEEMRLWSLVRSPEEIKHGMDADDGLGPGGFENPGVDLASPGLVAYWRFDEGSGYRVRDATGRGHDLVMLQEPQWVVTRWLSTCGNGVVEGAEECDDGDRTDGDGCSSTCRVEPGWVCTGRPRSSCVLKSDAPSSSPPGPMPQPPQPHPRPNPQPGAGGSSQRSDSASGGDSQQRGTKHRAGSAVAAGLVIGSVVVIVLLAGFGAFLKSARAPLFLTPVSRALHYVHSTLLRKIPLPGSIRSRLGPEYNPLVVNPEEMDVSPEFISATPPRAPPGHPGSYYALGGSSAVATTGLSGLPPSPTGWLAAPPTPSPVSRSQAAGGNAV